MDLVDSSSFPLSVLLCLFFTLLSFFRTAKNTIFVAGYREYFGAGAVISVFSAVRRSVSFHENPWRVFIFLVGGKKKKFWLKIKSPARSSLT